MKKKNQIHVVFLGIPSRGHIMPTLRLVESLIALKCKVTYFNTKPFKDQIEGTGATFVDYDSISLNNISIPITSMEPHEVTIELQKIFFTSTLEILPIISSYHEKEEFDGVVYDQMALWGQVLADKYDVLSFCSNTMFLFSREEIIHQMPKFIHCLDEDYKNKLNKLNAAYNNFESYKNVLDIQTATKANHIITYYPDELLSPPSNFNKNKIISLGNRFDSQYAANTLKLTPESIIYISFGTVFNDKFDLFKAFIDTLITTKYQVIISTGNNETVYRSLQDISINSNVHIYKFVDQLEILSKASLFITHAGFNSMYEGLYFTVPMLMVPHNPEQYYNASRVEELNAGYLLKQEEIHPNGISKAITEIQKNWNNYKYSCSKIRDIFLASNTNLAIATKIKNLIKKHK